MLYPALDAAAIFSVFHENPLEGYPHENKRRAPRLPGSDNRPTDREQMKAPDLAKAPHRALALQRADEESGGDKPEGPHREPSIHGGGRHRHELRDRKSVV